MHQDSVREEQRNFGRSQQQEGTLHVRSGFNRSGASKRPAMKATPKGHEAFLKALEASEATVMFVMASSGEKVEGTVKHSDKYTVSVTDGVQTRVLFKHDISEFTALTGPKKDAGDANVADHESVE